MLDRPLSSLVGTNYAAPTGTKFTTAPTVKKRPTATNCAVAAANTMFHVANDDAILRAGRPCTNCGTGNCQKAFCS
ncbi:hypothetical protein WJX74_006704 [Apatococcus lobatus]|uniref:Uncharacterized protein n=2 Tax=Apatococcus TaxID=904362 RepID=A0AAW1SX45_9CHLO